MAASVLVEPTFDAISGKAKHKLKLTKKEFDRCRLFVFEGTARALAGTELLRGRDLADLLGNDTTVASLARALSAVAHSLMRKTLWKSKAMS